jgi:hypothetical protein
VTDPTLTPLGASISPAVALINHSCDPNAVVVFPRASQNPKSQEPLMQVVTLREIKAGEEVSISCLSLVVLLIYLLCFPQILTSYIDVTSPKTERQKSLTETYNFTCACTLCSSHEGNIREALWCPKSCGGMCPLPIEGEYRSPIPTFH